jgi:AcrR family transcriptional regulator
MLEKGQRTKEQLFDTAVTLIKEKGFDNVTVEDICNKAGVAKGTFYIYYESKSDIIRESYKSDFQSYLETNYQLYVDENPNASHFERLRQYLLLEIDFIAYTGLEIINRAYIANFSAALQKDMPFKEISRYTELLARLIEDAEPQITKDKDRVFFETRIITGGIMSFWGLKRGYPAILEHGRNMIDDYLIDLFDLNNS